MKKVLILAIAAITVSVMSSCRSGCNCPGGGGYKKNKMGMEQPKMDNTRVKLG